MGSTELGVGIVLVCLSVAIAALWGSDRGQSSASHTQTQEQVAPESATPSGVEGSSAAP